MQALEGIDIKKYWSPKLYIENTLGDPKENIRHRVNFNDKGEAYIVEKRVIKGTFMENLELNDFPFDVQVSNTNLSSAILFLSCFSVTTSFQQFSDLYYSKLSACYNCVLK